MKHICEWRDIVGYEAVYMISDCGEVLSLKREKAKLRILKFGYDRKGYRQVSLCMNSIRKQKQVHRLVAEAFLFKENNSLQVNHKDGIKTNNKIDNLEWVTGSENIKHAFRLGLKSQRGEKNSFAKFSDIQIEEIRTSGISCKDAMVRYGISHTMYYHVKNKTRRYQKDMEAANE